MKDFISSTLLVVASFSGAVAADSSSPSAPRDVLADLSASLQNSDANGDELRAGDFAGALACTADLSTGDVTDEAGCATATDSGGAPCVWCDASAILGQGACVSPDIKSFAGQFWDQLCAEDAGDSSSPSAPRGVLAELSTSLQNPDANGDELRAGDFAGALACTADLSTGDVTDEAGCATATDAGGAACVWCDASAVLGQGACVSPDIKSMAGQFWDQLCASDAADSSSSAPHDVLANLELRAGDFAGALACTADLSTGDLTDEAGCATTTDAGGAACVWCDASAILGQGACVSPDIKSFAGQFWDQLCVNNAEDSFAELSASLQNPEANSNKLQTGDFAGALACTADLSTGDVTNEAGCATATDGGGAPCVWCDASAIIGQGACVSSDIKSMAGQFWDQLCAGDAGSGPATPHGLRGRLMVE